MSEPIAKLELFDETFSNLQNAVNMTTKTQAVIAQNIANAKTPGYEPMDFDKTLNKAVKRANKTVVFEDEMNALSKNSLDHSAYIKLLAAKISVIRTVVTQGKK
jgi:flagellar basal body rod protein FlgB